MENIVNSLKAIFSRKKAVLVETKDGELLTVIPHKLSVSEGNVAVLTISDDGVSNVREILVSNIVTVSEVDQLSVPDDIASSTDFWSSRFFSLPASYTEADSFSPQEVVDSVILEENPVANTEPGADLQNTFDEKLNAEVASILGQSPYVSGSYAPPVASSLPPMSELAVKPKVSIATLVITGLIAFSIATTGIIIAVLSNFSNFSVDTPSDSGSEEYAAYEKEYEEWLNTVDKTDYYNGEAPVALSIDSTEDLTEYDSYRWWGPYVPFEEGDESYSDNDVIPSGWTDDSYGDINPGYVLPGVSFDQNITNQDINIYVNEAERCSVVAYSAVLSVSKMESLGSTDREVTENIMNELVTSTVGQEPKELTFAQWYEQEGYVELLEYEYSDLSEDEYVYSLRGFASNGFVLVLANNCGFSNEDLARQGIIMEVDANVEFPYYASERKD